MEIADIAVQIEGRIQMLVNGRNLLAKHSIERAKAIAEYEKALGMTLLKLRNNAVESHEDYPCKDLPVTMLEKVAKSIIWQEKLNMEQSEAQYKVILTKLNVIQAELNGYQSINRHLSHTGD